MNRTITQTRTTLRAACVDTVRVSPGRVTVESATDRARVETALGHGRLHWLQAGTDRQGCIKAWTAEV